MKFESTYEMNLTGKEKSPPLQTVISTNRTVTKVIVISQKIMRTFSPTLTEGKGCMESSTLFWKLLMGALNKTVGKTIFTKNRGIFKLL